VIAVTPGRLGSRIRAVSKHALAAPPPDRGGNQGCGKPEENGHAHASAGGVPPPVAHPACGVRDHCGVPTQNPPRHPWWQRAVFYEVYVRSFQDSNGDGIGDLAGVIDRLDYLEWLGVTAIWLTPFYPSPMVDGGYDIADYRGVDPRFGTLETFDRLVAEAHRRSLRVIVDLVPNHTSDQHPWFVDARSSRTARHRDWYLWHDPGPEGAPPNNWISEFGGSSWQLDERTGQYYLHSFAVEQPDLNWRNREVREAMYDVMRFWLDRAVDGFRIDVLWYLVKDELWRHNPVNPYYVPGEDPAHAALVDTYGSDQPEVHEVVAEMREVLDEYEDRVMVGEIYLPVTRLIEYYGWGGREGVHLPFNFHLITQPWDARGLAVTIDEYEGGLPANAWPTWVIGNHDKPRVVSRVGTGQARVATLLLCTLRGTPTVYYGDELGMPNGHVPHALVTDPLALNAADGSQEGRDEYRSPMAWTRAPQGGFTSGSPWIPLPEAPLESVEGQRDDPDSFLGLYRKLLELRRAHEALQVGRYLPIPASGDLLAFRRLAGEEEIVVAANLGHEPVELTVPEEPPLRILLQLVEGSVSDLAHGRLRLAGDDAVIALVRPAGA